MNNAHKPVGVSTEHHHHYHSLNELKKEKKWAWSLTIAMIVIGILIIISIGPGIIIHKIIRDGKKLLHYGEHEINNLGDSSNGSVAVNSGINIVDDTNSYNTVVLAVAPGSNKISAKALFAASPHAKTATHHTTFNGRLKKFFYNLKHHKGKHHKAKHHKAKHTADKHHKSKFIEYDHFRNKSTGAHHTKHHSIGYDLSHLFHHNKHQPQHHTQHHTQHHRHGHHVSSVPPSTTPSNTQNYTPISIGLDPNEYSSDKAKMADLTSLF